LPAPDKRDDTDARDLPGALETRLASLPAGHPAELRYVKSGHPDTAAWREAEYADHLRGVQESLADCKARNLTTRALHSVDGDGEVWTRDRRAEHDKIIGDLYAAAADVPSEGKAIIVGGLPGAGKTTVLREHLGAERSDWLVVDPDVIKYELAARDLVPRIEPLTPMEATELAHEESSHIAKRLAVRALAEHKNVVWDITMASEDSLAGRIGQLRQAGYTRVEGIFVDVPVETSLERVAERHRKGDDEYRTTGAGLGGRLVPDDLIEAHADQQWGSLNRRSFEQLKDQFDAWYDYDNSGGEAVLKDQYPADRDQPDRDQPDRDQADRYKPHQAEPERHR
jgi:predicted ABC-type ATPase